MPPSAVSDAAPVRPRVSLAVVAGLFIASLALRPQIIAIGPLLPLIRTDLDLSAGLAGLLATIPVLCMGAFAPIGPRLAARLGSIPALTVCLGLIAGFGLVRAIAPGFPLVLLATLGIGVGVGMAGAVPAMIVSQRLPDRPALGTGAYAGGIVAGSAVAAAVAVPFAIDGDWRASLAFLSLLSLLPLVAWVVFVRSDPNAPPLQARAPRLPWRSGTGWLLVLLFGLQSLLYYGIVTWLPNIFVERGWSAADAGSLVAILSVINLVATLGVPVFADRVGTRRGQLVASAAATAIGLLGLVAVPSLAVAWVILLGLALGAIFPLVLTLPIDVATDASEVGSVAALMLLGGYVVSSIGPVLLGTARDATGSFEVSLWILVAIAAALVAICASMSPARLHRGIRRPAVAP